MVDLPGLRIDDGTYEIPNTEYLHQEIVQSAIDNSCDFAIISPTLRSEYLDNHALAALFQNMGELTPVFIISPNTSIRDRFEQLRNGMHYSHERWPLSTVKADGALASRTTHSRSSDAPPGVIFTRYSTRLPNDEISQDIRLVLYDDAVKFEEERWDRFQEWRERNNIPSIGYFIRDPVGPVYQQVENHVDAVWTWTTKAIQQFIDAEEGPPTIKKTFSDGGLTVPAVTRRERELLKTKADGQSYQIHLNKDSPVVDGFANVWTQYEELKSAADDINERDVYRAVRVTQRAISGFSRLLSDLRYSDNYRAEHGSAVPLSGRIGQVKRSFENLHGDAAAGVTPVEHVHYALTELRDTLVEGEPGWWKRGAVLKAMQKVVDQGKSLIVVAPDRPAKDALQADLRIEREGFYSTARKHVNIHTPKSLIQAEPVDYLLLYGPPKYSDRWLLRAPTAPYVGILTYPHELGLLYAQVRDLNSALHEAAETNAEKSEQSAISRLGSYSEEIDSVFSEVSESLDHPTTSTGFGGVTIDIPSRDKLESGSEVETSEFDDYQLVEPDEESIDDIISGAVSDHDYSSTTKSSGGDLTASTYRGNRENTRSSKVTDCIDVRVKGGKAFAAQPGDKIEVVKPDAGTTIEKPVTAVQPGEKVVAVHDTEAIRDSVEELLLDSGNFDLVGYARLWKNQLNTEIQRHDDDLYDFIAKVENHGVSKTKQTYRAWYNGEVQLPKAKASLKAIAEAYEMTEVLEHFDEVWESNHTIWQIKNQLIELLKKRAQQLLSEDEGDVVLDEKLDVRLSDFKAQDEAGNAFVDIHIVTDVVEGVTVARGHFRSWRDR